MPDMIGMTDDFFCKISIFFIFYRKYSFFFLVYLYFLIAKDFNQNWITNSPKNCIYLSFNSFDSWRIGLIKNDFEISSFDSHCLLNQFLDWRIIEYTIIITYFLWDGIGFDCTYTVDLVWGAFQSAMSSGMLTESWVIIDSGQLWIELLKIIVSFYYEERILKKYS